MTNYDAGRRFEWETRDALIGDGYDVIRSAGSKTKVDLAAFKPGQVLLVQCKRDGRCSPAERADLLRVAAHLPSVAVPLLAYRDGTRLVFARLTGAGPRERVAWTTDLTGEGAA